MTLVDDIKSKVNIVDFVRSYVTLYPAGRNLKGLCPFHQEKTPSFIVSPDRKIWHCFGSCGEGGDVIKFAMKYENLDFPEAVRFLAEKAGMALDAGEMRAQREFGALYDIHESAMDFFRMELAKSSKALAYLKERGLTPETISEFELGFAPGGEALTLFLIKAGFDINDIVRSGLSSKSARGPFYDRFQYRIIFPIMNPVGKVIAFTGRILPEFDKGDMPKYLNSPETPIFNKSKILYGFQKSRQEIAHLKTAILVEGQMDFLMAWQAGAKNIVAVSGTALTNLHLEKLRRIADSIIVSFDNDEAGFNAFERSLELFNSFDFHVKVLNLGKWKDPGEAAQNDPQFFLEAVRDAEPAFKHLFEHYFKGGALENDIAAKKRVVKQLLMKIKILHSSVEQEGWIRELAKFSYISERSLLEELASLPTKEEASAAAETPAHSTEERIDLIASRLITLAFTNDDFWGRLRDIKERLPIVYEGIINNPRSDAAVAFEMRAGLIPENTDKKAIQKEFDELIKNLEIEWLKGKQAKLTVALKKAESDEEEGKIMNEITVLAKRINELRQ